MTAALQAEDVLCGDETPANVIHITASARMVRWCRARRTR
jgi:hypothetical protein